MGRLQASEFAAAVWREEIALERALEWHLTANHYPPIPVSFVRVCREAIELANEGHWDTEVELPKGTSYRGEPTAPVLAIVEQHHLESFIDDPDQDY